MFICVNKINSNQDACATQEKQIYTHYNNDEMRIGTFLIYNTRLYMLIQKNFFCILYVPLDIFLCQTN